MKKYTALVLGSGRHCHVTEEVFKALFGGDRELTKVRDLGEDPQSGYLSGEKVTVVLPKGEFQASILGPYRKYTQVEISKTDAISFGVRPKMSNSGILEGTDPVVLVGPAGRVELKQGLMIVRRHLHLDPLVAQELGIKDTDAVRVRIPGPRALTFEQVSIAPNSPGCDSVLHIDYDEMNAAGITNADQVRGEIIFCPEDVLEAR